MGFTRVIAPSILVAVVVFYACTKAANVKLCDEGKKGHCKYICCNKTEKTFGCCPSIGGVCCPKGDLCCPKGYVCHVNATGQTNTTTCKRRNTTLTRHRRSPQMVKPSTVDYVGENAPKRGFLQIKSATEVMCPGGARKCPSNQTCCVLANMEDACCPLEQAVCCSDGLHCCPHGYTCEDKGGACQKPPAFVLLQSRELIPVPAVEDVTCHDGSVCASNQTCCITRSKTYGCCPLAGAVCCADHVHCCPSGDTCSTEKTCLKKDDPSVFQMMTKLKAHVGTIRCHDGTVCVTGNTCCMTISGKYGCCPDEDAVCCPDKIHCCPKGTTCDDVGKKCRTALGAFLPLMKKKPAEAVEKLKRVDCPDGRSCPDNETCCLTTTAGVYGCCPSPNAVCCTDHIHCCPGGTTCDLANGTCDSGNTVIPMVKKVEAQVKRVGNLHCPDGSLCPNGNTCCKTGSDEYGCCPSVNAVCCSQGKHCCPEGSSCIESNHTCNIPNGPSIAMLEKMQRVGVVCPDGGECSDNQTCCKVSSDQYGCCPVAHAVCCADEKHCCPEGYTCGSSSECVKESQAGAVMIDIISMAEVGNVVCADGSNCSDNNTCCPLPSGKYSCCPLPNAVCCSDQKHCCPLDYACSTGGMCVDSSSVVSLQEMVKSKPGRVGMIECPDGRYCNDNQTCCETTSKVYGCCPLREASCCDDNVHCCQDGYTCNNSHCIKSNPVTTLLTFVDDNQCPDDSKCPSSQTCCQLTTGRYGCCPASHAMCCKDHVHCCASGYECSNSSDNCVKHGGLEMSALKLVSKEDNRKQSEISVVKCSDGSLCPDSSTCCLTSDSHYGCCAVPNATCCSDGVHCCPQGESCGETGSCSSSEAISITQASERKEIVDKHCPDNTSCSENFTCCPLTDDLKKYGCCPLESAVCCSDHLHCCPNGFECSKKGVCSKVDLFSNRIRKIKHGYRYKLQKSDESPRDEI
eukprot:m.24561 g.24561  ORF g.24561 m.24561 type:complete len:964 (+) comp28643_c0_seq1:107-2998(+)